MECSQNDLISNIKTKRGMDPGKYIGRFQYTFLHGRTIWKGKYMPYNFQLHDSLESKTMDREKSSVASKFEIKKVE